MSAGYSKTPLVKKLGIKAGFALALLHTPENYSSMLSDLPDDLILYDRLPEEEKMLDFAQAFYVERNHLEAEFMDLKRAIKFNGMIWISWYKKAAKIPTDITEDVVRELALTSGLVDVKVAAIDQQWSGLKLVYRKEDRQ